MDPFVLAETAPWVAAGAIGVTIASVWGWVHNTKLKIQHGYPLEGMWGQSLKPDLNSESMERVRMLTQENAALRAELSAMKERVTTVERIVTDSGFRLTHEIDRLRDQKDAN